MSNPPRPPSTTCAHHDDGTASELWRGLSYQVGDAHAHRICRCIDLYCRIVRLPVKRLRCHVPTAADTRLTYHVGTYAKGDTNEKALEDALTLLHAKGYKVVDLPPPPPRSRPVVEALDKVKALLPLVLEKLRVGGDRREDDGLDTLALRVHELFVDLERSILDRVHAERREKPMRVVETVGLGRLPDLVPEEPWTVAGDAKSAWISTEEKRLFILGPLPMAVPVLRLVCDIVNEARAIVRSTQVPSKAREEMTSSDAFAIARLALPWVNMTLEQGRENMAHVLLALHGRGVRAAWEMAHQGAHGVLPSHRMPGELHGPTTATPPGHEEKPDAERGLYEKYRVARTDGSSAPGQKHHGCEYFVLDLDHDPHALPALRAYAMSCAKSFPTLAADLSKKVLRLDARWTNAGAVFGVLTNSVTIDPEKARAIVGWTDDDKPR